MVSKKSAHSLLVLCILFLFGCFKSSVDPYNLHVQLHLPDELKALESQPFIPADIALPITFTLSPVDRLPPDSVVVVRIIDSKGQEYHRRYWPIPSSDQDTIVITRLFRMENLLGSRPVILQAGVGKSDGHMYSTKNGDIGFWHDIFSGTALHSSMNLSDGWFPIESDNYFYRRCDGKCLVLLSQPLLPTVMRLQGSAPIKCFDDEEWTLTVLQNTHQAYQETITRSRFDIGFTLQPGFYTPDFVVTDQSWPGGELNIEITSDKTYSPHVCQGSDDKRTQAFHIANMEKGDFAQKTGFYGPREADHHFWTAPNCSVHLPVSQDNTVLYIQGRRDTNCMKESQTMQLFLNGVNLGDFLLDQEYFMLSIPCISILQDIESGYAAELSIAVSPVFFRAQCMASDDPNAYGVGIDEICFRPPLP